MTRTIRYLTHPQVTIDPDIPVPEWSLSVEGAKRVTNLAESGALTLTQYIYSSDETKALQTAGPLAADTMADVLIRAEMRENDRSATGYLPSDAFEAHANAFFDKPDESTNGWETAIAAQTRIVAAVKAAIAEAPHGEILFVGHGGVGTLLYCAFGELDIDRVHDQGPGGGGNFVTYDGDTLKPLHHWLPMESLYRS
ncbi:MAG: histidine phosphatase family protein [Pseudomonadota bacterium]